MSLQRVHDSTSRFPPLGPARSVPQLHQYYQDATTSPSTIPPRFVAFAWRYHPPISCFAPTGPRWVNRSARSYSGAVTPRTAHCQWNRRDLPSSWGTPMARSPCSLTPVGQPLPDPYRAAAWPPLRIRRRRQHCAFRGSITPLSSSLCTLRRADHSTTAQHSLPGAGQALPDRLDYLQGSSRRFQILHLIPLLQAWLGASPNASSLVV